MRSPACSRGDAACQDLRGRWRQTVHRIVQLRATPGAPQHRAWLRHRSCHGTRHEPISAVGQRCRPPLADRTAPAAPRAPDGATPPGRQRQSGDTTADHDDAMWICHANAFLPARMTAPALARPSPWLRESQSTGVGRQRVIESGSKLEPPMKTRRPSTANDFACRLVSELPDDPYVGLWPAPGSRGDGPRCPRQFRARAAGPRPSRSLSWA